jgi:hypothetical protein
LDAVTSAAMVAAHGKVTTVHHPKGCIMDFALFFVVVSYFVSACVVGGSMALFAWFIAEVI